jgi:DNA mismatch endonuclease (patch repair protein)
MTDSLNSSRRSENMRRIRAKDTKPEMVVRRLLHSLGYRYRLHVRDLPGKPDVVFRKLKRAIFVHGCFWHQHGECREGRLPGTRPEYWVPKLARNVERDQRHAQLLGEAGWQVLTLWECQIGDLKALERTLRTFLIGDRTNTKVYQSAPHLVRRTSERRAQTTDVLIALTGKTEVAN